MSKVLHVVDTDYRTNIMVPYNFFQRMQEAKERWEFIGKCHKVLPPEAQYNPIVTIGVDENGYDVYGYFIGSEGYSNMINSLFEADDETAKAKEISELVSGEHEVARGFFNGQVVPVGHLVNTGREHYDDVLKLLEQNHDYEVHRVTVKKNK